MKVTGTTKTTTKETKTMKPKAKLNQLRAKEAREEIIETFNALTNLAGYVEKRLTQIDPLDSFVVDQWETDGGK